VIEHRRVRFTSIEGIERADIALACEIWLDDLCRATWVSPETMRLGVHLMRYITRPDPQSLTMRAIEMQCLLGIEEVRKTLGLMRAHGVVESYYCDRTDLKVALHLSILQRLRTLESRHRFQALAGPGDPRPWSERKVSWVVPEAAHARGREVASS
jgi:hypothetical protein